MAAPAPYARFAKRDLEKTSWLAPLVNHPLGDLLNIELRHEQLFFVDGDRVLDDVGYSEKGRRFSEAEFGKPIRTLADLPRYGYWFVGRSYDLEAMREALRRQQDGYYYSVFSNQCQDWADRLARAAEHIERERGIAPPWHERRRRFGAEREVLPTEPGSVALAVVALALASGAFLTPIVAGRAITLVFAGFFLVSAVSNIVYALHARDWSNLLFELLTALIHATVGVLLLVNHDWVRVASGAIIAAGLGAHGLANLGVAAFSRPRSHWAGKALAGVVMVASAALIAAHWPLSGDRALGFAVGLSLLAGGFSTILLSWKTRQDHARLEPLPASG